jgi:DNA uptake protein ComE-like DNA-binding protein
LEVGKHFRLRVLLVFVDDENNIPTLQELNKIAFACDFTLILAWSNAECARYLETFKAYETKPPTSIQEKVETEFLPKVTSVLGNIRSVNKTDAVTLLSNFGNLMNVFNATEQELMLCPGIGEKKVKRLFKTLHEPFLDKRSRSNNDVLSVVVPPMLSVSSSSSLPANNRSGVTGNVAVVAQVTTEPFPAHTTIGNNNSSSSSSSSDRLVSTAGLVKGGPPPPAIAIVRRQLGPPAPPPSVGPVGTDTGTAIGTSLVLPPVDPAPGPVGAVSEEQRGADNNAAPAAGTSKAVTGAAVPASYIAAAAVASPDAAEPRDDFHDAI